jgi:hypothetical protein
MARHASSEALVPAFDKKLDAFEFRLHSFFLFPSEIYVVCAEVREEISNDE